MSHATIYQASQDRALQERVIAAVQREAFGNPTLGDTEYGRLVKSDSSASIRMVWPVAVDYETEYAFAVDSGNPNPGGDPAVITDGNISSAVQTHWPADPAP